MPIPGRPTQRRPPPRAARYSIFSNVNIFFRFRFCWELWSMVILWFLPADWPVAHQRALCQAAKTDVPFKKLKISTPQFPNFFSRNREFKSTSTAWCGTSSLAPNRIPRRCSAVFLPLPWNNRRRHPLVRIRPGTVYSRKKN